MSTPHVTASSAMPAGTRLGEFEITGVVGEGGFGIVYSARDSSLDRIVAIKEYLPAAFASRTSAGTVQVRSEEHSKTFDAGLSSFINEARMLAKFSHPGLVEVFRFWEANGTAYMAMRYYRGITLREMLRTNPQVATEQWLCETLDPILLALQELHNEKCYHRDIAPDNILVLPNGRSVLMDFGAARRIIGGMTRALTTVLKPGYAPIEQYSDDGSMQQGAWTDIYAVGGLLYHAMTGKVPVQAISRMMNDPLKPVAVAARGDYSQNLCNVVMKCLAVMPENRYQTIDELRAALGWVTTPVSSTVMFQKTGYVKAPSVVPSAPPAVTPVPVVAPAAALDPLAQVGASATASSGDALADLLASAAPAPKVAPAAKTPPAAQPSAVRSPPPPPPAPRAAEITASGRTDKKSALPLVVVGIAALAVVGSAAYLLVGVGGDSKEPPVVLVPKEAIKDDPLPKEEAPPPVAVVPEKAEPVPAPAPPVDTRPPEKSDVLPPVNPATPTDAPPPVVAQPTTGTVAFDIKPWGRISVNGAERGASPPVKRLPLAPGTYTIEITNPAGPSVSRTVEVVAGKSVTVRHAF